MASSNEFLARRLSPALGSERPDFFAELGEFFHFLREEMRPFPGRGYAVARLVIGAVTATILCQTLRIPEPAFAPYLLFFVANEDGVSSVKVGLLAMIGVTISVAVSSWISICFMDAPWFRVPVTLLLIGGAVWLSRTLVLAVMGRLIAVVLALYLSLADTTFNPEQLTEATLWLWSIVGIAVGVSALVSVLLEPRPDLLLRAHLEAALGATQEGLEALASGRADRTGLAKSLRRQFYATPLRLRQLLARWRQRAWPRAYAEVDWELGIFITERLLSATAALAALDEAGADESTRRALGEFAGTIGELKRAAHARDREAIRTLAVPSPEALPEVEEKAALTELAATLAECRLIFVPPVAEENAPAKKAAGPKLWSLVPDALTNPEHVRFAIKTMLAVAACEIFLNAVDWPGIRTCMITCVVTALATGGAQRQKQLLRLTGACVGGVIGLAAVLWIVPRLDTIAGLSVLIAAGTACCAWVAAGSVRSSYAGFQMALAFFIMLLPGFETSVDLTSIRDRFAGIIVGILSTWIFFDHLWHTSSRRRLVDKLVDILHLQARAAEAVSPTLAPAEAHRRARDFRRSVVSELDAGRGFLDETKIELTLSLAPRTVYGPQLEAAARDVSFAAFALLALNEKKLRLLDHGRLTALESTLIPVDEVLARNFERLADAFARFRETVARVEQAVPVDISFPSVELEPLPDAGRVDAELRAVYEVLDDCVRRISALRGIAQRLV